MVTPLHLCNPNRPLLCSWPLQHSRCSYALEAEHLVSATAQPSRMMMASMVSSSLGARRCARCSYLNCRDLCACSGLHACTMSITLECLSLDTSLPFRQYTPPIINVLCASMLNHSTLWQEASHPWSLHPMVSLDATEDQKTPGAADMHLDERGIPLRVMMADCQADKHGVWMLQQADWSSSGHFKTCIETKSWDPSGADRSHHSAVA